MHKVAVLLLSPLDYDSRVKKQIKSLVSFGLYVAALTVNTKMIVDHPHVNVLQARRRRILPGVSSILLHAKYLYSAISWFRRYDAAHCNDLNTLSAGIALKIVSFGRIKVIYDAHEFESNQVPNQAAINIWLLRIVEGILIRFVDEVITVSPGIAFEYSRIYGIDTPKVVLNCPPFQIQPKGNIFRKTFDIALDKKIFLYQGALTFGRGIELLLEAFGRESQSHVVIFMGYGPLEEQVKRAADTKPAIFFHPAVSQESLLSYTRSADVGIVVADNVCRSYDLSLPNKLFEFVMAGLPVVVSNLSEMSRFVQINEIGSVVQENTVHAVEIAISEVLSMDSEVVKQKLISLSRVSCWEVQEMVLQEVYRELNL